MGALLQVSAERQPLIREATRPQDQNVRASLVYDVNGDVNGDDYHGFSITYASKIYPLDQMTLTYTHLNPEQSTMSQVMLGIEEYWPITDTISPYGSAGGGYIWIDYDEGITGESQGWFGKLGLGILFKTGTRFDIYAEVAYQVSDDDLWVDGTSATKANNTHAILGVRMNY